MYTLQLLKDYGSAALMYLPPMKMELPSSMMRSC